GESPVGGVRRTVVGEDPGCPGRYGSVAGSADELWVSSSSPWSSCSAYVLTVFAAPRPRRRERSGKAPGADSGFQDRTLRWPDLRQGGIVHVRCHAIVASESERHSPAGLPLTTGPMVAPDRGRHRWDSTH